MKSLLLYVITSLLNDQLINVNSVTKYINWYATKFSWIPRKSSNIIT